MPVVQLITNIKKDLFPKDFSVNLSSTVHQSLKWPDEKYINVHILSDQDMIRGGDGETPCATLQVSVCRIGKDVEKNRQIINTLMEFVSMNLNIPKDRIACILHDLPDELVGLPNGGLVSDIPK
ncbi:MIF-like protein mif-2 [Amphiura filiformis]|uniref:MIF-like protein mif-2 n=1 Tax=Amphiura filiformis TaxID=82378 RepID=UPI003B20D978